MNNLDKIYTETKCKKCKNKNDFNKCDIRQFIINGFLYCKCINCNIPGEKQEIKVTL